MNFKDPVRGLLRSLGGQPLLKLAVREASHAGLVPPSIWKRLPVQGIFRVALPDGRSVVYSGTANDGISRSLFWRGIKSWESETIRVFYRLAKQARLVVDIGANTGVYAMLACAANPQSRVLAFEPVTKVYNKLVENILLNGWQERCQARQEAVSNIVGTIKMQIPFGDMPVGASLRFVDERSRDCTVVNVPATTIDACLKDAPLDLAKIDTEGSEEKVLEGMQHVLATSAPTLIIECLPDGPYRSVQEILENFGYRFFHLRKQGPVAVDRISPDEREVERNFLCLSHRREMELF